MNTFIRQKAEETARQAGRQTNNQTNNNNYVVWSGVSRPCTTAQLSLALCQFGVHVK